MHFLRAFFTHNFTVNEFWSSKSVELIAFYIFIGRLTTQLLSIEFQISRLNLPKLHKVPFITDVICEVMFDNTEG